MKLFPGRFLFRLQLVKMLKEENIKRSIRIVIKEDGYDAFLMT